MSSPIPLVPPPEFSAQAEALGITFDPGDVERLGTYLALLLEANKTHNLTAITDEKEAWTRHILDALTLVPFVAELLAHAGDSPAPAPRPPRVIDIGSGGGVPGIPLAIVLPDVQFTLLEATGKKVEFLRHAAAELKLSNVTVLADRAERIGQDHKTHRGMYDMAIARALGHLSIVAELAIPLVRVQGLVLAVKGQKAEQEIAESAYALELLKAHHELTHPTPTGRIVVLRKDAGTPRPFPRHDGEPKRKPLSQIRRPERESGQ